MPPEHYASSDASDIALRIESILTSGEKSLFLEGFTKNNPHWQGANVADILYEMWNVDVYCGEIESFFDQNVDKLMGYDPVATSMCFDIVMVIYGDPMLSGVENLLKRYTEGPK